MHRSSTGWARKKKTRLDPQALAIEMASDGAPEGTVMQGAVTARKALSFSVILRPKRGPHISLLAPIATFCASEGVRKDTGIITWIRWPSEVVAGANVIAATSLTTGGSADAPWAILNFRINRGHLSRAGSTSLEDLLGVKVDPDMLVAKIVDSLWWMHSGWIKEMYPKILPRIASMLENVGGKVVVDHNGRAVPGVVRGVDENGSLIIDIGTDVPVRVEDRSRLLRF